MKKLLFTVLSLTITACVFFSGCASKEANNNSDASNLKSSSNQVQTSAKIPDNLDLTLFSGTALYAQVTAMNMSPEDYVGKTIKLRGFYEPFTSEETNTTYHNITVYDTTACCGANAEFILNDGLEYPEADKIVIVEGKFSKYTEGEQQYYYIAGNSISVE